MITRLQELFAYDANTGIIRCKIPRGTRCKIGDVAGSVRIDRTGRKYLIICVDYKSHYAHRIAWMLHYGDISEDKVIDHKNGDGTDNRIKNLRLTTQGVNCTNRKQSALNTSGYMGVFWEVKNKRWRARIRVNGKIICLGLHKEKADAIVARHAAERKYGFATGPF